MNNPSRNPSLATLATLVVGGLAPLARAELLAFETFDSSPAGPATNNFSIITQGGSGNSGPRPLPYGTLAGTTWLEPNPTGNDPKTDAGGTGNPAPGAYVQQNANAAIDLGDTSGQVLTYSVDIKVDLRGTDNAQNGNGLGHGFFSAPGGSGGRANFTGLVIDDDGAVNLIRCDATGAVTTAGTKVAFAGTWNKSYGSRLSFKVDTATGNISNINLTGSTADYTPLQAAGAGLFTAAATRYAGFVQGNLTTSSNRGYVDNWQISNTAPDETAPRLTSIVDNAFGGPVWREDGLPVLWTVTFDEDIDAATLDATDFENAGTAGSITVGKITKTSTHPYIGVFTVEVTPAGTGTLRLQVRAGATITDVDGNPLDTSLAFPADTTLAIHAGATPPTTLTGTAAGPGGDDDNWNNAANWDNGLPHGTQAAVVGTGAVAQIDNAGAAPPTYSGGLTLEANAMLRIGATTFRSGNINALGTGPITMKGGSELIAGAGLGTYTFTQPLVMAGNGTVWAGVATTNNNSTKTFAAGVSGHGMLTYNGVHNTWFRFNTNNKPAWSGGLKTADPQNQSHQLGADADGCFGSGSVAINHHCALQIKTGLSDTIDNGAKLSVNGTRSAGLSNKLILGSNETVRELWVDQVLMEAGNYTSASGLLDLDGHPLIGGTGTLTVLSGPGDAGYEPWVASFPALSDPNPALDFEGDGLATGIEYVLGANPTLNDSASVAPRPSHDASGLGFTFRRSDVANNDPTTTIVVEYGSDLTGWAPARQDVDGVTLVADDDFHGIGIDRVIVTLPTGLATNGRLFARLSVTITPPLTLLDEDFEGDDNGDFTVVTTGGTPWEWGTADSPDAGGGAVTTGNGDSAKCWGTNLVGRYAADTDTSLRSPVMDLTGATAATLSFARAIDANVGHTLEVNVIDATTAAKTTVIAPFEDPDPNTTPWKTISIPIPAAALGKPVYLEWRFIGNGADEYLGAYIDDVVVTVP